MVKILYKLFEKIGLIPEKKNNVNQPCYDKYGRFIGWYSRSVAVAAFVFCKGKDDQWYVLGSARGPEAADYRGYWNCTCGYLDYGETVSKAAVREVKEETGVDLSENELKFVGYEDSPSANRQNITFRFAAFITDRTPEDFNFSHDGNEGKEVGEIKWIDINEISEYKWAFNHDARIKEIFESYGNDA